jgi:hypothetical protein
MVIAIIFATLLLALPVKHGIIHSLLDKFGFILCVDRDRELFFHSSEYNNTNKSGGGSGGDIGHSDKLNIGDEVEFRVGVAPPPRGGGDGGEEGNEKMSAYDAKVATGNDTLGN